MMPPAPGPTPGTPSGSRAALPPAAWYPDPAGGGGLRWWNGSAWTEHTVPVPGANPVPQVSAAGTFAAAPWPPRQPGAPWVQLAAPAVARETRLAIAARVSLALVAAVGVLYAVLPIVYSSAVAGLFHWFRLAFDAAEASVPRTPPPVPAVSATYVRTAYLCEIAYAVAGVVFLVWQYRAADAARRLGIPAHHRPGWGVAFWFIPVANLWCPLQALRDCLPPGHPGRRRAVWCWLAYLAAGATAAGVYATAPYHRQAAVALAAVDALLFGYVTVVGGRLIGEVRRAHRQPLAG